MTADRRILVLIGAGSAVFTRGLLADLISARDLGDWDDPSRRRRRRSRWRRRSVSRSG